MNLRITITDVLIVGAGPTGLVLALWLTRMGVRVRIVDKTTEPGTTSRALAVQARTLELYSQIGLADAVVERGRQIRSPSISGWPAKRRHVPSSATWARASARFPYALIFPQDEHERLLIDRLAEAGVEVERETELLGFEDATGRVLARLKAAGWSARRLCEAAYIAGCDGAHSAVREALEIGFPGGEYDHLFYVADVEASGATMNGELHVGLDTTDFLARLSIEGRRARAAHRHSARGSRTPARQSVVERREPARDRMDAHRRQARELVLDLPRAPSGRRSFPQGSCVPARRRRAHPQSRRRTGHEHRHRRRGEPRLETRGRPASTCECLAPRQLRAGTNRLCPAPGRDHRSSLHRRDQLRGDSAA